MTAHALDATTYLPDEGDAAVARVYDFLTAHEQAGRGRPAPRYFLAGSESGDRVEIPEHVYRVLHQVVDAMQRGLAVTVAPRSRTLTTQQAADLLGISRPTLVRLLESGRIPFDRVGSHRRVTLHDVLDYRERQRAEQYAALAATAIDPDEEDDLDTLLRRAREARRAVALRHRAGGNA